MKMRQIIAAYRRRLLTTAMIGLIASMTAGCARHVDSALHDVVIRGGTIYDGSGVGPYVGDLAIDGDRIVIVGGEVTGRGRTELDARGKAVAPGFINVLSWANESLLVDGRAQSDIRQGVTLEVFGEGWSMGPLSEPMKQLMLDRQGDIRYPIEWATLGEYLETLERRGVAPNVASFVGATTIRMHVLGEQNVEPDDEQLSEMRSLVRQAMEEGALGVGSSLIYVPATYAKTSELVALAEEAGNCGGIYVTHMRSEADRLLEAVEETLDIAVRSGAPAEIYHLKAGGRNNWHKMEEAIRMIEDARSDGILVTTDMYTYAASSTGLNAAMPPWVQEGGLEAWIERLKRPRVRARVIEEMRSPGSDWESAYLAAGGAAGTMLVGFRTEELKPLVGRTLADVAELRGVSPEDVAVDLIIEDGSRVSVVYFTMSEENVRRKIALPYMSFGSDAYAPSAEGVFLKSSTHPRAYGNFARLLGRYVRDERIITLQDAVRRLTSLPAANFGLRDRGRLTEGYFADVVVFDPETIQDHATFEDPHRYASGVSHVLVNGVPALRDGEPTAARSGRVVRGRAWRGWEEGGCRDSSKAGD